MKYPLLLAFLFVALSGFCADQEGYASWYAGKFQGRITASGEVFDTNRLTAAHKTLIFGTVVRVTNSENGKSVDVRINDRGPFVEGRIIDLSRAAAEAIDMTGSGIAHVTLEILSVPRITVTIQVGAYSREDNAVAVRRSLVSAGFSPVLEKTAGGIHRIVIPDIPEAEAEALLTRVKAAGYPSSFIRRNN